MPVITVEGYLGSGYQNIGRKVARKLNIDFVDRILLSQVAKLTKSKMSDVLELEKSYAIVEHLIVTDFYNVIREYLNNVRDIE